MYALSDIVRSVGRVNDDLLGYNVCAFIVGGTKFERAAVVGMVLFISLFVSEPSSTQGFPQQHDQHLLQQSLTALATP